MLRGIGVALAGAIVGTALGVLILFAYQDAVNLGPEPSITELQRLEVASLLLLTGWAIIVIAVMAFLQHRWRGARVVIWVAGGMVVLVGIWFLISLMSFLNECEAGHSYPLSGFRC
jgi:hypothetical protein